MLRERVVRRYVRRALGLLLGGNVGEIGLMALAGVAGLAPPLGTRQVLAVNLVTDILPAVAVAVQAPEHRDVRRRGIATAIPSFAAYLASALGRRGDPRRRSAVAFVTIVSGQLAQTLDLGAEEGGRSAAVDAAVAVSATLASVAISRAIS